MGSVQVLLIEDNPGDADLILELLKEAPCTTFETTVAERLSEGITHLATKNFDVTLLDLGLPDSIGMDTLIHALRYANGVPIVVLTGSRAERLGMEASRLGAQDYLVKGEVSADLVERSLLYAIERKKGEEEVRNALQTYADVVREIPSGLLTFQYVPPGSIKLIGGNPRANEIMGRDLSGEIGKEIEDIWPCVDGEWKDVLIDVLRTGHPLERERVRSCFDGKEGALDIRAFRIPRDRVCISFEDVTARLLEEELRKKAYAQIEKNIERFATFVDEIRNPNSVIIGIAERMEGTAPQYIIRQAERIESLVNRLDEEWTASETVRGFLRRNTR